MTKASVTYAKVMVMAVVLYMAAPTPSMALGIEDVLFNVGRNLTGFPKLLAYGSYIGGIVFLIIALHRVRLFVDQTPMGPRIPFYEVWTRFVASAFFFAMPSIAVLLIDTLGLGGPDFTAVITGSGSTPSTGLDGMFDRLMRALYAPMKFLIPYACYLIGISYTLIGIHRLTKNPGEGPRGPVGRGTLMTFLTAAVLMSIGSAFDQFEHTLFGDDVTVVHMVLSYPGTDPGVFDKVNAAIPAVLMFLSVVGWIAFVRGWLILRTVAEGHQASMVGGITHIVGGVMAANLPVVLGAVQATLGFSLIQS